MHCQHINVSTIAVYFSLHQRHDTTFKATHNQRHDTKQHTDDFDLKPSWILQ